MNIKKVYFLIDRFLSIKAKLHRPVIGLSFIECGH